MVRAVSAFAFFFSSRRRHTSSLRDWSSDVCSSDLTGGDLTRGRLEEALGSGRGRLAELEAEQEAAREQRVHWQVQEAHVAGGLRSAEERLQRGTAMREEAERAVTTLTAELTQLEADTIALSAQQTEWREARAERELAVHEPENARAGADHALA